MRFILQLIINGMAIVLLAHVLPSVYVNSLATAIWVAFLLGLLNMLIKPILVFLTLPITILTLGLFLLVINVMMIQMAAFLISGFNVDSFLGTLLFGLLLSALQSFLTRLFGLKK